MHLHLALIAEQVAQLDVSFHVFARVSATIPVTRTTLRPNHAIRKLYFQRAFTHGGKPPLYLDPSKKPEPPQSYRVSPLSTHPTANQEARVERKIKQSNGW